MRLEVLLEELPRPSRFNLTETKRRLAQSLQSLAIRTKTFRRERSLEHLPGAGAKSRKRPVQIVFGKTFDVFKGKRFKFRGLIQHRQITSEFLGVGCDELPVRIAGFDRAGKSPHIGYFGDFL